MIREAGEFNDTSDDCGVVALRVLWGRRGRVIEQ